MEYAPRIIRIVYRSNHHPRRVVSTVAKVPYSGLYALSETLARAITTSDILWYRIERVLHITPTIRSGLERWPDALRRTSTQSGVPWPVTS